MHLTAEISSFVCLSLYILFLINFGQCVPLNPGNSNSDLDTLKSQKRPLPLYPHFNNNNYQVPNGLKHLRADTYPSQRRYHPIHPMVRFRDESQQEDDDSSSSYEDSDERRKRYSAGELLSILTDMARDRGNYNQGYKGVRFGISR